MAESDKGARLKPHPIVAALLDDPGSPPDVVELVGYVGKATRPDHHRLYLSLKLDEYVDVPSADIVHHEEVPSSELAHGGTRIWVRASAQVIHETRQTTR